MEGYMEKFDTRKVYDPSWLVNLVREQYPDITLLESNLKKCTRITGPFIIINPKSPYHIAFHENDKSRPGDPIILNVDNKHTAILLMCNDYTVLGLAFIPDSDFEESKKIILNN